MSFQNLLEAKKNNVSFGGSLFIGI